MSDAAKITALRLALRAHGTHSIVNCKKCRPMPMGANHFTYYTSEDYAKWYESQPCTCGFSAALEL